MIYLFKLEEIRRTKMLDVTGYVLNTFNMK